jgi:Fe-S cluster assembly protein SufA
MNGIILSPAAQSHLASYVNESSAIAVLLELNKTGCNGYEYKFKLVWNAYFDPKLYEAFNYETVQLFVSKKDMPLMDGLIVDFMKEGLNSTFKYSNPQEYAVCGCGKSVALKIT